jgi:CNT family concentrative nucleoside transporter
MYYQNDPTDVSTSAHDPQPVGAPVARKATRSTESISDIKKEEHIPVATEKETGVFVDEEKAEESRLKRQAAYRRMRPFILAATAAVILGWWISATVLPATRHRWFVLHCVKFRM